MPNNTSKAALYIRNLALILLLLMPISALGSRFGLWPYTVGLLLFAGSMLGSLLIQIINAIWLLRKPANATKSTLRWASLFALPPLILVAALMRGNAEGSRASIHDISTDTINPPQFYQAVELRGTESNPLSYTETVAAIQRQVFPDVDTINSTLAAPEAFDRALATAQKSGWDIYYSDREKGIIEAVATTFWFGFKDDIVIRITAEDHGSLVDLRSTSRVGKSDLGANAKRILAYSELYLGKSG
jgi:hypothetical protein